MRAFTITERLVVPAFSVSLLALPAAAGAQPIARVDTLLATNQVAPAVVQIDQSLATSPKDYEVLWRASRVRLLQGDAAAHPDNTGGISRAFLASHGFPSS